MSESKTPDPWVCPWDICNFEQAQECRASKGQTKLTRGCGTYFPPGTTLEQAKQMIGRPLADTQCREPALTDVIQKLDDLIEWERLARLGGTANVGWQPSISIDDYKAMRAALTRRSTPKPDSAGPTIG